MAIRFCPQRMAAQIISGKTQVNLCKPPSVAKFKTTEKGWVSLLDKIALQNQCKINFIDRFMFQQRSSSIMQQPSAGPTANSGNSKNAQSTKSTALAKTNSSGNVPGANASNNNAGNATKKAKGTSSKKTNSAQNEDSNNDDFHNWCTKTLSAKHGDVIDGEHRHLL